MKNRVFILLLLVTSGLVLQTGKLYADGAKMTEYKLKAAYLFKIVQFVQLPERDKTGERKEQVIVAVTDKSVLKEFSDVIQGKTIAGRKGQSYAIVVKYVDIKTLGDSMADLDVLVFCKGSAKSNLKPVLQAAVRNGILTFGEKKGFLEAGGNIKFAVGKKKLSFEVNTGSAEQAGIKMRSQLVKLAQKKIEKRIDL